MLEECKSQVMNIAKRAQRDGLCKQKSGNFSLRDPETGYLVITPTGKDREALTRDDLIVMDMDASVIENLTGLKPTSEALMHLKLYEARPETRAIVHTHSMYATLFAVLNRRIPAITYEFMMLNCKDGQVPVAPYGRPGTSDLAESVVSVCRNADALLLKGHGAVTLDEDGIEGAYLKMCYLEEIAQLYYHVLAINGGKDPDLFPPEELRKWSYPSEISFPR